MYYCKNCGSFFDEDALIFVEDDPSPRGISLPPGHYTYAFCPECGDDDFEEFCLVDAIDIEEGENELEVVVTYKGRAAKLYLDEEGNLCFGGIENVKATRRDLLRTNDMDVKEVSA